MLLSQSCQVAIKSISHIAATDKLCVNVRELAEVTSENLHTIAKVLQKLVRANMLKSLTGPGGGFYLTKEQSGTTLADIVRVIDGNDTLDYCVLGLKQCRNEHPCPVHDQFAAARDDVKRLLQQTKLTELAGFITAKSVFLK